MFQPLIVIYRFCLSLLGCLSIYRPLSYPFRSLLRITKIKFWKRNISNEWITNNNLNPFWASRIKIKVRVEWEIFFERGWVSFSFWNKSNKWGCRIQPPTTSSAPRGADASIIIQYLCFLSKMHISQRANIFYCWKIVKLFEIGPKKDLLKMWNSYELSSS